MRRTERISNRTARHMADLATELRVTDPGIRALFTRNSRWQAWLDVEAALADAEADLGMIPRAAADEIARKAHLSLIDIARVEEGLRVTGHPLVPLIWELDRICEGDAGGFVHWGATTQNITQTGQILLIRRSHAIFMGQLARLLEGFANLAERTRDHVMPGRTHGQHAVPATFGYKVAVWIDELVRHVDRLRECEPRTFVAMLGGGAGTLASFGDQGRTVQDRLAQKLRLNSMPVPSRVLLDHEAEYVLVLAMLAATATRIAREIYTLMKEEFAEVEEPITEGTVGSSTMPQKRNPKLSQDIITLGAQVRAQAPLALESMMAEHEADRAITNIAARAIEEACTATGDILERLVMLAEGLQVFPDRMRRNLDLSGGLIMSETLMLELGREMGRQRAHDVIYDLAQEAATSDKPFRDLLAGHEEVISRLTPADIDRLLDPMNHIGQCREMADEQAAAGRRVAAAIRARTES
ncbi:MAG: adenylosuccinate lyase family protein [Dehalococcoidia bacterium]|nr:MAG: adenylosuccinate lyase family protein [Dehalococcoidia bacterium]